MDVGAGDGRILIAALAAGAGKATGFELQPEVHALGCAALDVALGAGTARRKQATLLLGDVREQSLPQEGVDVLTLFLVPEGLAALECWLSKQLEAVNGRLAQQASAGAVRIITIGWPLPLDKWRPQKVYTVPKSGTKIHLYLAQPRAQSSD